MATEFKVTRFLKTHWVWSDVFDNINDARKIEDFWKVDPENTIVIMRRSVSKWRVVER